MIDKPIAKISEQVEEYTEKRKQEKKEEILTFMRDTFADLPDNVSAKLRFKVYACIAASLNPDQRLPKSQDQIL